MQISPHPLSHAQMCWGREGVEGRTTCILPLPLHAPPIIPHARRKATRRAKADGKARLGSTPPNHDSPAYTTCMAIHMLSAQASAVKDPLIIQQYDVLHSSQFVSCILQSLARLTCISRAIKGRHITGREGIGGIVGEGGRREFSCMLQLSNARPPSLSGYLFTRLAQPPRAV